MDNPGQAGSARSRVRALLVFGGGTLLSWVIAIILGAKAMNMDPADGYPEGSSGGWLVAALFFAALPFLPLACFVIYRLCVEMAHYKEWMASLTLEERAGVYLAEAVATAEAAWRAREHRKQVDARLTSSVMGYTGPDGVTPTPTDQLRAMREQQMRRDILQAQHDALARRD
jgi:hypothetical protein